MSAASSAVPNKYRTKCLKHHNACAWGVKISIINLSGTGKDEHRKNLPECRKRLPVAGEVNRQPTTCFASRLSVSSALLVQLSSAARWSVIIAEHWPVTTVFGGFRGTVSLSRICMYTGKS